MDQDGLTYRRASGAALIGLWTQLLMTLAVAGLALYSRSPAVAAAAWLMLGGLPVWAVLWGLYHQHRLVCQETLDAGRVAVGGGETSGLFDDPNRQLQLARRRLQWLYRWGLSGVGLIQGVYLLTVGGVMLNRGLSAGDALTTGAVGAGVSTLALMSVTIAVAFVAFVVARYESGMTKNERWSLLRGGAGYLMGGCFTAVLLFVGSLFVHYENPVVLGVLGLVVPGMMVVVGAEVVASLALGIYRPRRHSEMVRPAFDSRLLGWMTSPGSIAEAFSDAINYQFGFEVSSSWFYKLLNRAVAPLVAFGAATLVLISGLVIVAPHQQAVVTRLGRNHRAPLGPGLHLKRPWPIDRVQKFDVGRVHQVLVGSVNEPLGAGKAVLWDSRHADEEAYLITPAKPIADAGGDEQDSDDRTAMGLSLVGAQIAVQYRIADLGKHINAAVDGAGMLAAISQRWANAYFVTHDIETLIGPGRVAAGHEIRRLIQRDADAMGLGLEVMFVGLISIHPPSEQGVATAFLQQIGAIQMRQSLIEQAQQEAGQTLASVAGSPEMARQIDTAIVELERAPQSVDQAIRVEQLLTSAGGEAAKIIYEARAQRWQRSESERAAAERFAAELAAFQQAPRYYRARRYLDALAGGLAHSRKYVLTGDQPAPPVFRIDLKDTWSTIDSILNESP